MSLLAELERFERLLEAQFPNLLGQMNPGLDDAGIADLRQALLPLGLTEEIETLYRWRNGGAPGIFGGYIMRPFNELLSDRERRIRDMDEPPAWLHILTMNSLGFVTLDVPGQPHVPGYWYCHSHDGDMNRLFLLLETLVASCSDAIDAGVLNELRNGLFMGEVAVLDDRDFAPFRSAREPGTSRYTNEPPGSHHLRSPEDTWPAAWLVSMGAVPTVAVPTGATHTIAQLIAEAWAGLPSGTIQGEITSLGMMGTTWFATLDDGTGTLAVSGDPSAIFAPAIRERFEMDLTIYVETLYVETAETIARDALIDSFTRSLEPPGIAAYARAVRPL